ncbi:hypothetical protein [Bacillus sp. FJAT-27916]|uniref:hypothetical protein n=1 Tax=Bacillus sp. FJAT-27916 TaxID=1679169 RepID=UPI000A817976|nr:hypothetical protein [Bacillus sp. FJAT-27916]
MSFLSRIWKKQGSTQFASMVYVSADAQSVSDFLEFDGRMEWPFLRHVLDEELKDREW